MLIMLLTLISTYMYMQNIIWILLVHNLFLAANVCKYTVRYAMRLPFSLCGCKFILCLFGQCTGLCLLTLLDYARLLAGSMGHRSKLSTGSCAAPISCQVYPIFLASDSTSRRQVFLGRPLFLFPWGFHVSACLVMLVVGFLSV